MTFLVFVFAIVGVIWGAVLALRGSPILGCAVYLIVACCFSGYFWSIDAAGLTWSLDRFFLAFLMIAFVVQRRSGKSDPKPMTRADLFLGTFFALLMLSTFTSDWRSRGPDDESVLMHLVNGYIVPLAIFMVARRWPSPLAPGPSFFPSTSPMPILARTSVARAGRCCNPLAWECTSSPVGRRPSHCVLGLASGAVWELSAQRRCCLVTWGRPMSLTRAASG